MEKEGSVEIKEIDGKLSRRALKYKARNGGEYSQRKHKSKEELEAGIERARQMGGIVEYQLPTGKLQFILGKQSANLKAIKKATNVKIDLDESRALKSTSEFCIAEISGSPYQVKLAVAMLDHCVKKTLEYNQSYTHFISIPIIDSGLELKFKQIIDEINEMNLPDIRAKYLTDHRRLHISLGNLKLPREKHITEAEKLLLSLKPELNNIIGFLGLNVEFKGIGTYPENEPEKAKYVYVKVDYDSNENLGKKFKDATDLIRERFYQAGLSLDCDLIFNEYVIIIKHQSENYHGHDLAQDGKYYSTFNALPILERFSDIKLGNFKIPLIQVCIRDTFRANGRYGSIAELNLS